MAVIENAIDVTPLPKPVPAKVGTRVPNASSQVTGLVELIRNQPVVASPLGLLEPLSAADVGVSDVALEVVAVGAAAQDGTARQSTANTTLRKKYRRPKRGKA